MHAILRVDLQAVGVVGILHKLVHTGRAVTGLGPRVFGEVLASIPEVVEAHLVSGDYDYLLRVVVKDTRDYERLLREKLYKIKGIRHSRSSFVLRTLKKADQPLFMKKRRISASHSRNRPSRLLSVN